LAIHENKIKQLIGKYCFRKPRTCGRCRCFFRRKAR